MDGAIHLELNLSLMKETMLAQVRDVFAAKDKEIAAAVEKAVDKFDLEAEMEKAANDAIGEVVKYAVAEKLQRIVRAAVESHDFKVDLDSYIEKHTERKLSWAVDRIVESELKKVLDEKCTVESIREKAAHEAGLLISDTKK